MAILNDETEMVRGKRKVILRTPGIGNRKIICIDGVSGKILETTHQSFKKDTEDFWKRRAEILSACGAAFTQNSYRSGNSHLDGLRVRWEQKLNGTVEITATASHQSATTGSSTEEDLEEALL